MVKGVNCYLNKGLKVISNKQGSIWIAMEAILLLLYVWNSAPIWSFALFCCSWLQIPMSFWLLRKQELGTYLSSRCNSILFERPCCTSASIDRGCQDLCQGTAGVELQVHQCALTRLWILFSPGYHLCLLCCALWCFSGMCGQVGISIHLALVDYSQAWQRIAQDWTLFQKEEGEAACLRSLSSPCRASSPPTAWWCK